MGKYKVLILLFILFFISSAGVLFSDEVAIASLEYATEKISPSYDVGFSLSAVENGADPITPVDANILLTSEISTNDDGSIVIRGTNDIVWVYWKVVYPDTKLELKLRADGPLKTEDREKGIDWRVYYVNDAGVSIDIINSADDTGISAIAGEGKTIMSKEADVQRTADSEHLVIEATLKGEDYSGYLATHYDANLYVEMVVGS